MLSPESSSTMRMVPCIAGCDGPMLSIMGSLGSSSSPSSMSRSNGSIGSGLPARRRMALVEEAPVHVLRLAGHVLAAVVVRLAPEAHALVRAERRELADHALAERDERLHLVGRVV